MYYLIKNKKEWKAGTDASSPQNRAGGPYESEAIAESQRYDVEAAVCSFEDEPLEIWRKSSLWTEALKN